MGEEVDQDLDAVWRQPIHHNLWSWFRRVASALPWRDALVSFLSKYFDPACVLKQAACESFLCCLAPWSNLLSCTCTVCSPYSVVCIVLYPPHSPIFSDLAHLPEQAVLVWFHSQTIFHCGFRKGGENVLLCLLGYKLMDYGCSWRDGASQGRPASDLPVAASAMARPGVCTWWHNYARVVASSQGMVGVPRHG